MKTNRKIAHNSLNAGFPIDLSKALWQTEWHKGKMNRVLRDRIDFQSSRTRREARKNIPRVDMSTQRFLRDHAGSLGHGKKKLETHKLLKEKHISSRNMISSPMSQTDHKTGTEKTISPWSQIEFNGAQTEDLQGQIMRNAEEYWWKSGYIEGLKRNLGETANKTAFSRDKLPEGTPIANDQHRDENRDTRVQVRRGKMSRYTMGPLLNRGNDSASLSQTLYVGEPRVIQEAQTRSPESETNENIKETRINVHTDSRMGVNKGRIDKVERGKMRNTRVFLSNSRKHQGTLQDKNTGRGRTLDRGNMGQAKVTNGQAWAGEIGAGTSVEEVRNTKEAGEVEESSIEQPETSKGAISEGTNSEPWMSFRSASLEKTRPRNGQASAVHITYGTNAGRLKGSITGQTRTTEGAPSTSEGQSYKVDRQSGTSNGQGGSLETLENEAVQTENAEISNSSPGR